MPKKKNTVNAAGNYTKPAMRKRQFARIKAGTKAVLRVNGVLVKLKCLHLLKKKQVVVISNGTR